MAHLGTAAREEATEALAPSSCPCPLAGVAWGVGWGAASLAAPEPQGLMAAAVLAASIAVEETAHAWEQTVQAHGTRVRGHSTVDTQRYHLYVCAPRCLHVAAQALSAGQPGTGRLYHPR